MPELADRWSELVAMQLAYPGCVVSHRSAAAVWELDGVAETSVEVTVPPRLDIRRPHVHRSLDLAPFDVRIVEGVAVTDPTRTLCDLGSVVDLDILERLVEAGLRRRLTSEGRLLWRSGALARQGRSGPPALRAVLDRRGLGVPPTERELETRYLQCLRAYGVRRPERQYRVWHDGRLLARLDDAWPDVRVFAELDGWASHRSKQAFRRDRSCQNALVLLGWRPLRFTWTTSCSRPPSPQT